MLDTKNIPEIEHATTKLAPALFICHVRKGYAISTGIGRSRYDARKRATARAMAQPSCNGIVERWATSALVRRRGAFVTAREARTAFEVWCEAESVEPLTATAFGKQMTTAGYRRDKIGGEIRYSDTALMPASAPARVAVSNAPGVLGKMVTVGAR